MECRLIEYDNTWSKVYDYFPFNSFHGIGHFSNPTLQEFQRLVKVMFHHFEKLEWSYAASLLYILFVL